MKRLFDKIFKKEPQFSYTIAEYLPDRTGAHRIKPAKMDITIAEYDIKEPVEKDEMEIDKIYRQI